MNTKTSTRQLYDFLDTKKGKTYTIAVVTVVTVIIMILFAIMPAILSITDKRAEIKIKQEYYEFITEKEASLKSLLQQEGEYASNIILLNQYLPDDVNDEFVLANLDSYANLSNINILRIDFKEPEIIQSDDPENVLPPSQEILQVPVVLSMQGDLDQFELFLRRIESFPVLMKVKDVSYNNKDIIDQGGGSESSGGYIFNINLVYYIWNNG